MEPLSTESIKAILRDPYGYFDVILSEPVLYFLGLWGEYLAPEMSPSDFILSYYDVLEGIRSQRIKSPLSRMPPRVYGLFFALFPLLLPTLLGPRATEVHNLWKKLMQQVSPPSSTKVS